MINNIMSSTSKLIQLIKTMLYKKDLPKTLGRWNINYCNKETNRKVDLANEDHCGPCGEYSNKKLTSQDKKIEPVKKIIHFKKDINK